jgi:hypothetical protein
MALATFNDGPGEHPTLVAVDGEDNIFLAKGMYIDVMDINGDPLASWTAALPDGGTTDDCSVAGAAFFPDDALVVFSDAANHCLLVSIAYQPTSAACCCCCCCCCPPCYCCYILG